VHLTGVKTRAEMIGYDPNNASKKGAASNQKSATRGLFIREFDKLVPESVSNRYSVIAELAKLAGHEDITRHLVRSILKRGHT